jgi:hypothetical protein
MVYQSQLQRNSGVVDPLILSRKIVDSYWYYPGWRTVKNFFRFDKLITPNKAATFGGSSEFWIEPQADKLGNLYLQFSTSALTTTAATPQVHLPRFVDWLGLFAWSEIILEYSGNEIYKLRPDECIVRFKQSLDMQKLTAVREICAGDKTDMRREALATIQQDFIVELPFPHTRSTSRWAELIQLSNMPKVIINWRPLNQLVQIGTDTAPVATISNIALMATWVHLEKDERDFNTFRTESKDGVVRLFEDFRVEKFTEQVKLGAGAGGNDIIVKLNNFRTATKSIIFVLRKLAEVNAGAGQEPNYTNFQPIDSFYLEATDGKIFEQTTDKFNRMVEWPRYHVGPVGPRIYEHTFANEPDDALNCTGELNLGSANNLLLKFKVPVALTEDMELAVMCKEYNIHQNAKGDWQRAFR